MKWFFLVIVAAALLAACSSSDAVPDDIIQPPRMETIVWQLMESDDYVSRVLVKDSLKKAPVERMKIYEQVFQLNNTTLDQFKKSYQYYLSHPDLGKLVFDSLSVRAGRQRADMFKPKPLKPVTPVKR